MSGKQQDAGLRFVDDLVAEGEGHFAFADAVERLGRSPTATANLLSRLCRDGLIERVRRGHYAIRRLGVLGTAAASEDVAFAVAAGFEGLPHRIGYRTALELHDLVSHPSRQIQVATERGVGSRTLSGRPLRVVLEPPKSLRIGAQMQGATCVSDIERALLDAAARPELVGGASALAEAVAAAAGDASPERLTDYAQRLGWKAALRRIGTIADALELAGLANALSPISKPTSDIDLEPGTGPTMWRDSRWWVRWAQTPDELSNVAQQ